MRDPQPEEVALPREDMPADLDLETLLRTAALYLEAIRDGLEDASFAETFDQYGPLWDGVHDGCVELLEILDGEPEEPERDPEPIPEPAAAESTAIPISQRIMQVLGEAEHPLTNAAIARAVGMEPQDIPRYRFLAVDAPRGDEVNS